MVQPHSDDHHDHKHTHGATAAGVEPHGDHGGGHHHHHAHTPPDRMDGAFAIGAGVNLAFVIAEASAGFIANSVALVADAAHNFGDVLSILLAWGAAWLMRRPPTARRTYGWGRGSILAALINATVLLIGVGAIGVEAIRRFIEPAPVASGITMVVAALGIFINGGSALLFRGHADDLNIRAQFLHLASDALVSAAVVAAAFAIHLTGWTWLDPLASLLVAAVILAGTWSTLREALDLSLDAVPAGLNQAGVSEWLGALPGVREVHDLHIWGLSTTETALTAHLVCDHPMGEPTLEQIAHGLRERFRIGHTTIQIETETDAELCRLRPADTV